MADAQHRHGGALASDGAGFRMPSAPRALTRRSFLAASALGLAGALAPFGLSGCSTGKNIVVQEMGESAIDTRLAFFGYKYEAINVIAIESIMRAYMDEHPNVSVSYEGIKSRPYFDALEKRLSTGAGDDVFMVDHDTAIEYEARGYLADLTDLPTIETFSALALSQMRAGGTIVYVPLSVSAFGMYCNIDLLEERGIAVPRTFAEFERACEAFLAEGIVPLVANNDTSLKTLAIARGMAEVYASADADARIAALGGDPAAMARQLRPGLDMVELLVAKGYVDAPLALKTEKTSGDLEQFATGARPFMLTGAWASVRVHDMAPDLAFEVHPYPVLDDVPVLVANADTRVSVNAGGDDVEEAKDFVAFLTKPENVNRFVASQCSFSSLEGNAAPDDASVQTLSQSFKAGGVVIGSDDAIRLPVWGATRASVVSLLGGATAAEAETRLREALGEEGGGA